MHARDTGYYCCTTSAEYRRCHAALRAWGSDEPLRFPTIYAERQGALMGVLGTTAHPQVICAGPLLIAPTIRRPIFVAVRLLEVYESVLQRAGITAYTFGIAKEHPAWYRVACTMGAVPTTETPTEWWLRRFLHGEWRAEISSAHG